MVKDESEFARVIRHQIERIEAGGPLPAQGKPDSETVARLRKQKAVLKRQLALINIQLRLAKVVAQRERDARRAAREWGRQQRALKAQNQKG